MSRTLFTASAIAAILFVPSIAGAQASSPSRFSIGVEGGAQAVQNVGGLGGAQIGLTLSDRLSVVGEAVYLQDVVTRRRAESATTIATYLAQTQGKAASGALNIPAWAVTGGARFVLKSGGGLKPYVVGQGGVARVALRPSFSLGGADVTTTLPQYGVTLGADLTGTSVRPVVGGGIGVMVDRGPWYFDASVRVLSIQLPSQPSTVSTLAIGIGRKF